MPLGGKALAKGCGADESVAMHDERDETIGA